MANTLKFLIPVIASVASALAPPVQEWIANNPTVATLLYGVVGILGVLVPSPKK